MITVTYGFFSRTGVAPIGYTDRYAVGIRVPVLAPTADGGFVAVFPVEGFADGDFSEPDAVGDGILAQRFDANGAPVSDRVTVNVETEGWQTRPAVATAPDGRVFVAFNDEAVLYEGVGTVRISVLDADLAPLVDERTVVFADDRTNAINPAIRYDPVRDDVRVVAMAGNEGGLLGVTLDAGTLAVTDDWAWDEAEFTVQSPAMDVLTDGTLVVAAATVDAGLRVIRLDPFGARVGFATRDALGPHLDVAALPGGGFVLARDIDDQAEGDLSVATYDANGVRQSYALVGIAGGADDVSIEVLPTGHFVTYHVASFGYRDAFVVANAFSPDGEVLLEDIVLSDGPGAYGDLSSTTLLGGEMALAYANSEPDGAGEDAIEILLDIIALSRIHEGDAAGDRFEGDGLDDVMFAGDGADTLVGAGGGDFLVGEGGADLLLGGPGDDVLYGDAP